MNETEGSGTTHREPAGGGDDKVVYAPLARLKKLHKVDVELHKVERALGKIPRRKSEHEAVAKGAQGDLEAFDARLKDRLKAADGLELDLKSAEAEIEKIQVQLNSVKTNAEYQTLTTKIESMKADNGKLEEQILEIMEGVEELRGGRGALKETLKAAEKERDEAHARLDAEKAELEERVAAKRAEREGIVGDVPAEALATYERILKRGRGSAMAGLRDQHCLECHMEITTNDLTRVLNGELVLCRTCSHILYMADR